MASVQRLRELSTALQSIKGQSNESVQALNKLSRELEIFIQRAEQLKGEQTSLGLVSGIGGSEAELAATRRNLGEVAQGFKEVNAASSGAFTGMVTNIRQAIQNLDILNTKQQEVYRTFATEVSPGTTMHPSTSRFGMAGGADPSQLQAISGFLKNVTTDSKEAQIAVGQFAQQLETIAEKMMVLSRSKPGQFAAGGGRAVGFTEKELNDLDRGLRMLENLKTRSGQPGPFVEYAQAVREAVGSIDMAADSQRKFLDTLQFREIGTSALANVITQINAIGSAEKDASAKAVQLSMDLQKVSRAAGQQMDMFGGTVTTKGAGIPAAEEGDPFFGATSPSMGAQRAISPMLDMALGDKLNAEFQVITGSVEQLGSVLGQNEKLMKAVQVGVDALEKEFKEAGLSADSFTVKIDAANQALQVTATQAQAAVKSPAGIGGAVYKNEIAQVQNIQDSVRVGLGDAQVIDRAKELSTAFSNIGASAAGVKNLETSLEGFGLTLNDIRSSSYDANEGIVRFSASADAGAGIMRQATVVMNQNGEVMETVKRKYEGFGGAITNSINKVIRWGIAVGIVYGGMTKLRQAITEMIDLETAFADITIITGKSLEELGGAFESVVSAAEKTGISLSEATAAFEKALRAAGRTADESERVAKATTLMTDSLILSRLANVDQAQAVDMLTGALRQMGLDIDQGTILMDKWVATNRTAFVGLETLAESFAIVAAQASAVGVSIDQLNGIIGTIAEVTTLSATEVGNFARTILSALESDQATQQLQQYGIAVKDVSGDLRNWGEVIQDVYDFWRAGAISDRELASLGRVLGGGARRGPQFVAFLKEYGRVNEIAAVSAEASGDAAEALDIKMDTLRNTVNELSVAFSALAGTLGEEGGLLDFMTNIVELATGLVSALDSIGGALGGTTTQLIAFVAAYATLSKLNLGQRLGGGMLASGGITGAARDVRGGVAQAGGVRSLVGLRASGQQVGEVAAVTMTDKLRGGIAGIMPGMGQAFAQSAISYMATGDWTSAGGTFAASIIGYAGWGALGSMIAATAANVIFSKLQEAQEVVERPVSEYETAAEAEAAFTQLAGAQFGIERIGSGQSSEDYLRDAMAAAQERAGGETTGVQAWFEANLQYGSLSKAELEKALELEKQIVALKEQEAEAAEEAADAQETAAESISEYAIALAAARRQYEPGIQQQLEVGRAERIQQFAGGEIPRASYTRFLQVSEQLPQTIAQIMVLLEDEMVETFGVGQEAANEMANALADMDPAAITFIQERLAGLQSVRADIDGLSDSMGNTAIEMEYATALHQQYSELAVQTSEEIVALIENAKAAAAEPIRPQFTRYDDLSGDEFGQIYAAAIANQKEYADFVGLTSDEIADAASDWVYVVEGGLGEVSGLWKLFFDDAFQKFQEAREQMQEEEFHVRRLQDVDPGQMGEIQARNRYWIEYLSRLQGQSPEQYLEEEGYQENLILGPNNVWQKILTTSEAMSFTLQDILETEKKQLEGMWNIPEGATFWVPLTSLFYQNQGSGGGVPALPPIDETKIGDLTRAGLTGMDDMGFTGEARPKEVLLSKEEAAARFGIDLPGTEPTEGRGVEELENLSTVVDFLRQQAMETDVPPTEFFERVMAVTGVGREGIGEDATVLQRIFYESYNNLVSELRPLMGDPASDEEIADYLLEASSSLLDTLQNVAPGATGEGSISEIGIKVGDAASRALDTITTFFGAPLELNAQFQIESEKALMIQNIITLDGSVIKAYISEIMAQETAKSAKVAGFTGTLMS